MLASKPARVLQLTSHLKKTNKKKGVCLLNQTYW